MCEVSDYDITVGLIDDDSLALQTLEKIIPRLLRGARVLWATTDGVQGVSLCADRTSCPDLVLVDMSMEIMSGPIVCQKIRRLSSTVKLLAMTAFSIAVYADEVAESGAQGIVSKNDRKDLQSGLQAVARGFTYGDERYRFESVKVSHARIAGHSNGFHEVLTLREFQVMDLLSEGLDDRDIASRLGIAPATVRKFVQTAMRKLGAENRVQAVIKWNGFR